jgi:arabinose-5-phosphate isomerase
MTAGTAEAATTGAGASATDLEAGRRVLALEAEALAQLARMLDASFTRALDLLAATTGRVVVSGMGKSGLVGRKIAATLASTGTPAQYKMGKCGESHI